MLYRFAPNESVSKIAEVAEILIVLDWLYSKLSQEDGSGQSLIRQIPEVLKSLAARRKYAVLYVNSLFQSVSLLMQKYDRKEIVKKPRQAICFFLSIICHLIGRFFLCGLMFRWSQRLLTAERRLSGDRKNAYSLKILSDNYSYQGHEDKAIQYYKLALKGAKNLGNKRLASLIRACRACSYWKLGKEDKALKEMEKLRASSIEFAELVYVRICFFSLANDDETAKALLTN